LHRGVEEGGIPTKSNADTPPSGGKNRGILSRGTLLPKKKRGKAGQGGKNSLLNGATGGTLRKRKESVTNWRKEADSIRGPVVQA